MQIMERLLNIMQILYGQTGGGGRSKMQEYMRASRNKAYDLIWSGEIDSYRLGRKLLVSRASVDAYIESRSGRK